MRPFESLREYERFVYSLTNQFPKILRSTLVVVQRGRCFAELIGEIIFPDGYRLNVYERLSWDAGPLTIEGYSYEVWQGSEELYWYDSQPHAEDPALASSDPESGDQEEGEEEINDIDGLSDDELIKRQAQNDKCHHRA